MAYSELVKNFEKIRAYMREFYVYGFKNRSEYDAKSARSYDDERRRIESWLGDYMGFRQNGNGKNVFLSVDSRVTQRNPFFAAWKAKSFTDGDITIHFLLFDILDTPERRLTLTELLAEMDERLVGKMTFDESTVRKKLKEYTAIGIIETEKDGRRVLYRRGESVDIRALSDPIAFFREAAPCGVIGSFLEDRLPKKEGLFRFKHHYITHAMDSEVLAMLFDAMSRKRRVAADHYGRHSAEVHTYTLIPLRIYISAQNGRQYLIAYWEERQRFGSYRLDHLSDIRLLDEAEAFDALRSTLDRMEAHIWGVNLLGDETRTETVSFEVRIVEGEEHIIRRLEREKRCGTVEKVDDTHYRYTAEVFDTTELIPWIRTFLCRITKMNFSNRTVENRFKEDIRRMYELYGIEGGDGDGIQ